jgi:hypothetical protein
LKLKFRIDTDHNDPDFVAVVLNFDGPDGVLIVEGVWLKAGEYKRGDGQYLYITSEAEVFGEQKPDVRYIRLG